MTLVAALIAAAAALIVVIIDRVVAAQREETRRQKDYRRSVYARFLAARQMSYFGSALGDQSAVIAADIALALAEIELAAPQPVISAAEDLLKVTVNKEATTQDRDAARGTFIDLARADVGSAALPQDG